MPETTRTDAAKANEPSSDSDSRDAEIAPFLTSSTPLPASFSSLNVPHDAGVYALGLAAILTRMQKQYWRHIDCGPGWYDILVELDQKIAALYPEYEVEQVKQKLGTLRYYCSVDSVPRVRELIKEAYERSATHCEDCGAPAVLNNERGWIRTSCVVHQR